MLSFAAAVAVAVAIVDIVIVVVAATAATTSVVEGGEKGASNCGNREEKRGSLRN